jgi:hypothetical protein
VTSYIVYKYTVIYSFNYKFHNEELTKFVLLLSLTCTLNTLNITVQQHCSPSHKTPSQRCTLWQSAGQTIVLYRTQRLITVLLQPFLSQLNSADLLIHY